MTNNIQQHCISVRNLKPYCKIYLQAKRKLSKTPSHAALSEKLQSQQMIKTMVLQGLLKSDQADLRIKSFAFWEGTETQWFKLLLGIPHILHWGAWFAPRLLCTSDLLAILGSSTDGSSTWVPTTCVDTSLAPGFGLVQGTYNEPVDGRFLLCLSVTLSSN